MSKHGEALPSGRGQVRCGTHTFIFQSQVSVRVCRAPAFPCGTCLCSPSRYGQLSGMVEPLAGLFGAFAVVLAEPILPYALAFAAGTMVYVVVDDIIPEAQIRWESFLTPTRP